MQTRRQMLQRSATVAGLLAGLGLLPEAAQAAWNGAAFEAKTMADLVKALGARRPTESKDVTITGPDIAENGAVVPVGCSSALAGVKRLMILVEKNPSMLCAVFDVSDSRRRQLLDPREDGPVVQRDGRGHHGRRQGAVRAEGNQGHAGRLRRLTPPASCNNPPIFRSTGETPWQTRCAFAPRPLATRPPCVC
jgi:sulfur-oxidizing protein SoxY